MTTKLQLPNVNQNILSIIWYAQITYETKNNKTNICNIERQYVLKIFITIHIMPLQWHMSNIISATIIQFLKNTLMAINFICIITSYTNTLNKRIKCKTTKHKAWITSYYEPLDHAPWQRHQIWSRPYPNQINIKNAVSRKWS